MKKLIAVAIMAILPMIAGCGGGGGGSAPQVALKLSAQGTLPAGKAVAGLGATLELPAGVTVKTAAGGVVDPTVVVPSGLLAGAGNATMGPVTYTAATATGKAKLNFTVASTAAAGVGVGEYVTITCIFSGVAPTAADFTVLTFDPVDLDGNPLSLTGSITVALP